MRKRYSVIVIARRGVHEPYTYVAEASIKPGKVERVVYDTARDILEHETRGAFTGYLTAYGKRATVVVGGRECCRFVVTAREIT